MKSAGLVFPTKTTALATGPSAHAGLGFDCWLTFSLSPPSSENHPEPPRRSAKGTAIKRS
jgi:hypothetical protein